MMAGRQVKSRILAWGLRCLAAIGVAATGATAPAPSAQDILRSARLNESGQHRVLDGHLRHGAQVVPFRLVFDGDLIRYEFSNPPEALVLRLGEHGSRLEEVTKSGEERVSQAQFDKTVRGTDITYEDIALKFLYWPNAALQGEETKLTRRCWKLALQPASGGESQYGTVILWVEEESGAFLQADAFDHAGKLVKRFKVIAPQRINGEWILKKMRIERLDSGDDTPTYLEIDGVEK